MEQEVDPLGPPVPSKKRRGKSKEQRDHDKLHEYSTVQMKLKTVLGHTEFREDILDLLDSCSFNISRIVFEAWMLAEMHVLRMIDENKGLPEFNQSFFNSCCVNVSATKRGGGDAELKVTAEQYRVLRPSNWKVPENAGMSHLMSSAAKEMETAFTNHVTLNLFARLKRYVHLKYNVPRRKAAHFIVSAYKDKDDMLTDDQKQFKNWLGLNPLIDANDHKNIPHFLMKTFDILTYYDSLEPNAKGKRSFSLLPKKNGYSASFIHIDETTLRKSSAY
jgi:hypothetical protein